MKHRAETQTVVVMSDADRPRRTPAMKPERRMGVIGYFKYRATLAYGNPNGVSERRQVPIMAYVGFNGSGKTQCMILDTLPTLEGMEWDCDNPDHAHTREGQTHGVRHVLSTVQLYDENGDPHPLYIPFDSWDRLSGFEHGDLLMDEMTGVAHSRHSSSLPPKIELLMNQFRKADIAVRWTAPDWARADKLVRETTRGVTVCAGSMAVKDGTSLWPSNRRFRIRTFDAAEFDEFTYNKSEKLKPLIKDWFWAVGHRVREAYDTKQSVIMLGVTSDAGVCVACAGTRRRPECSCDDYVNRKAKPRARRPLNTPPEADQRELLPLV